MRIIKKADGIVLSLSEDEAIGLSYGLNNVVKLAGEGYQGAWAIQAAQKALMAGSQEEQKSQEWPDYPVCDICGFKHADRLGACPGAY